ncbi:cytochrome P450 [Parapedomonas caeni]
MDQSLAISTPAFLPPPPTGALAHIPGETGWPVIGTTLRVLADPHGYGQHLYNKYGPVYRTRSFGMDNVALAGPDGNELVLFDRDRLFSSRHGWGPVLDLLFPRGLMLMDFDEHRLHRRMLSVAFKTEPMRHYLDALNDGIARRIALWRKTGEFLFYPAIKALTLDLAATSFLGIPWGPEADRINQAFVDMVAASIAVIRKPLPGTLMARGVRGRKFMSAFFAREIPARRGASGDDIFTQLCNATDDDGRTFSDQEIIDHMIFLMMAAHDTLTSSVTSMVYFLARDPEWQQRLREELASAVDDGGNLAYERLGDVQLTEYAFKEALRINAPVPSIPRRALRDFEFKGYHIPAGTMVGVSPLFTHRMPEIWPEPMAFDPWRFTPANSAGRHKYAWVPFGGGGHMCLGLHFAYMQAKAFLGHLLVHNRVRLPAGYQPEWQLWPMCKPRDGMPVIVEGL